MTDEELPEKELIRRADIDRMVSKFCTIIVTASSERQALRSMENRWEQWKHAVEELEGERPPMDYHMFRKMKEKLENTLNTVTNALKETEEQVHD